MPDTTLTINHAGGGSETYTINRDKFEGIRTMTRKLSETAGDPENITAFTITGTNDSSSETYTKQLGLDNGKVFFENGDALIYWTGSEWRIRYDGDTYYNSSEDVAYPWEVNTWTVQDGSGYPIFGSFVGGSIDSVVTDTVSVDHTPPEDLRNLLVDAENVTIDRAHGGEIRTLFIDGVEVTIDRTGEVIVEGFLTLFPNAAAAYSLQRLNGHQALINARRGSDGVEVDVYPDSSANREVSADSPITVTSGSSTATTLGEFLAETTPARNRTGPARYQTFIADGVTGFSASRNGTAACGFDIAGASGTDVQVSFDITLNSGTISVKLRPDFETGSDVSNSETITTSGSKSFTLTSTADFKAMLFITAAADYVISNFSVNVPYNHDAFVTTWYDQAGSNDASQPLDDAQPKIAEGGSVLADGIEFITGYLVTTSYIVELSQNNASVFSVAKPNASTAGFILSEADSAGGSSNFILGDADGGFSSNSVLWVNTTTFGTKVSGESLMAFTYDGTNFQAYVNGAASGASGTATVNAEVGNKSTIGANYFGSTTFNGSIKEIITYKSDQSANRADIEANINGRYSIY